MKSLDRSQTLYISIYYHFFLLIFFLTLQQMGCQWKSYTLRCTFRYLLKHEERESTHLLIVHTPAPRVHLARTIRRMCPSQATSTSYQLLMFISRFTAWPAQILTAKTQEKCNEIFIIFHFHLKYECSRSSFMSLQYGENIANIR